MMYLARGSDNILNGDFDYATEKAGALPYAPDKIVFTYIAKSHAGLIDNNDDDDEYAEEMRRSSKINPWNGIGETKPPSAN